MKEHYWHSVILPNKSFNLDTTELNEITYNIIPDEEHSVHSVQINGNDQPIEADGTKISLPGLQESTVVNAVFVSNGITSSIETLESYNAIKVSIRT